MTTAFRSPSTLCSHARMWWPPLVLAVRGKDRGHRRRRRHCHHRHHYHRCRFFYVHSGEQAKGDKAGDIVDTSLSLHIKLKANSDEAHPIVKEQTPDEFLDANSSLPIDLEAKNGDVFFITEVMTKEEEQLYRAQLNVEEEEEAKKREEATRLSFDPMARFSFLVILRLGLASWMSCSHRHSFIRNFYLRRWSRSQIKLLKLKRKRSLWKRRIKT